MSRWKERIALTLSDSFEYYDLAIFYALYSYIGVNFFPESYFGASSVLMVWMSFSLRFLSRPIGGFVVGKYADKFGRRKALIATNVVTGLATFSMACLPNFDSIGLLAPVLFFMMQLLQSFSFGGEHPIVMTHMIESASQREKARTSALVLAGPLLAIALSLLIVWLLESILNAEQMKSFGWRIPLFIGIANLLFSLYFKSNLKESRSFQPTEKNQIQWYPALKIFLLIMPSMCLFYANSVCSKSLMSKIITNDFLQDFLPIVFNIFFFIACLTAAHLIDKYGDYRRVLKINYIFLIFLSVPIYALQSSGTWLSILVSQVCITVFIAIALSCIAPIIVEQITTKNRALTIAISMNIGGSIYGGLTPLVVNVLSQYGQAYVGLLLTFGGLAYFLAISLDKYTQNELKHVQSV